MYKEYLKNNNDIFFLSLYRINGWGGREVEIIIYLLTGYEGIASLLSPRQGTTNLLFLNTQSINILLYPKTLDS